MARRALQSPPTLAVAPRLAGARTGWMGRGGMVTNTPGTEASTVHRNWRLCVVGAAVIATISKCRRRVEWFKAGEEQTSFIRGSTRIRFLAVADPALAANVLMFGSWSALTRSRNSRVHANPGGARGALNRRRSGRFRPHGSAAGSLASTSRTCPTSRPRRGPAISRRHYKHGEKKNGADPIPLRFETSAALIEDTNPRKVRAE